MKAKNWKTLDVLELAQNTSAGVFYGGLTNVVVNHYKAKPPCVLPGALAGGLLFFGVTRGLQNLEASKIFNDIQDTQASAEIKL